MLSQSTINKVILLGTITKEPRWHSESGEKVLYFTVITTEKVRKNADFVQHEEHHNVRVNADMLDYALFRRGQLVYIQGKIQTKQFMDEENVRRYKTEIVALSVELINAPQEETELSQSPRLQA